jgi:hypothetical protein
MKNSGFFHNSRDIFGKIIAWRRSVFLRSINIAALACLFVLTPGLVTSGFGEVIVLDDPYPDPGARFGVSIENGGGNIYIGADKQDVVPSRPDQGQVFVFDALTGSFLYDLTDPEPTPSGTDAFGIYLLHLGDLNGDLAPDLAVGAYSKNVTGTNQGQVLIFSGDTHWYNINEPDSEDGASFGRSLVGLEDNVGGINIAVGANGKNEPGATDSGQGNIFSAVDGLHLTTLTHPGAQYRAYFGKSMANIWDINSDGFDDIAIGAWAQDAFGGSDTGAVYALSGADGTHIGDFLDPAPQALANFGYAIATGGDTQRIVAIGAYGFDGAHVNQGRVHVFLPDGTYLFSVENPEPQYQAAFGVALDVIGDVDGDLYPEIAVGAHNLNQYGKVYIMSGANGDLLFSLPHPNPQIGSAFGRMLRGLGDINGDSVPDLAVAAWTQDVLGVEDMGQVYVFLSSDTDGDGITDWLDADDDNDALTDYEESILGTDPLASDTDLDDVDDMNDVFPLDAGETRDSDRIVQHLATIYNTAFQGPSIFGDRVLWTDEASGDPLIYEYSISSGVVTLTTPGDMRSWYTDDLSGDRLIYIWSRPVFSMHKRRCCGLEGIRRNFKHV